MKLLLSILLLAAETGHEQTMGAIAGQQPPITREGCPDKCGETSIPFPFGMARGCFRPGFQVVCNHSFRPPRAFLADNGGRTYQRMMDQNYTGPSFRPGEPLRRNKAVELIDVSVDKSEARIYTAVSSICSTSGTHAVGRYAFTYLDKAGPFLASPVRNVLVGVGARVEATMVSSFGETEKAMAYRPSCLSDLVGNLQFATDGECSGRGCCVAVLPPEAPLLTRFVAGFRPRHRRRGWESSPCSYGMVVQSSWYNFSTPDLYGYEALSGRLARGVPAVLDFAIRKGTCPPDGQQPPAGYACVSGNSSCSNEARGYVCKCSEHYHGNPYITNGCQDIDECKLRKQSHELRLLYPCSDDGICSNRVGGYDCRCKPGMKGDAIKGHCTEKFPLPAKVVVGIAAFIVVSVLMVMSHQLLKRKRFYEQNGGPVLKGVKNIRIYRRKQLKQITNNYRHIIGEGHFGKVYMGTLEDKQHVAIKISIKVDKDMKKEFIDEVIIQSGMRHKNIVRLLGCCLEVDAPMLVYEYAARGSLHDVLFGLRRIDIIPVHTRLGIAVGSAEGLAYMHSAVESTIRHGDVKSANILLDDKFIPKVSDFGTTRLLVRGKSVKTERVVGDLNYIDPIYMEHGVVTQKSDVYGFGVVLMELITRRPAIHDDRRSYVASFVQASLDKQARNFFDQAITSEGDIKLLEMVGEVAVECLKPNPEERLDMKQVEQCLVQIMGQSAQHAQETSYHGDLSPAPDDIPLLKETRIARMQ
ncbi:wall-associated receptor kinase 1-like [Triticum dicoccoides]|uniref:wall-associated receptor kinase 1-like n=1 Tax=Triticum dicoccoides TaxID=85692 RepID=UPI00188F4040|nr:wall-associated receptor kinase 1-like [Triticum dicoccoides]